MARRAYLTSIAVALAGLMLVACGTSEPETAGPALRISMPTVDGERIESDNLLGEDTLLWFWAPW